MNLGGKNLVKRTTIPTQNITITDPYVKRAQDNLVAYLLQLDARKFLYEIYKVAGLKPLTEKGYDGWERSDAVNFRGHFFGHFLSALALAYHSEKDEKKKQSLLNQVQVALDGLQKAQTEYAKHHPQSAGYVSAFREVALDEVEGREVASEKRENVLVPWYNLHKILAGLLEIAEQLPTFSEKALQIASDFGDYVYQRMMHLADKEQMLTIEYGGMNDALYHLFALTGKKEHRIAASFFDEEKLFDALANGEDVLAGKHANTTIPKFIGAMRHYQVVGDDTKYLQAAQNFWEIVVKDHTYCTGGNSQSEHFHEADQLYYDAHVRNGDCTCETCNTHNMLKLSKMLYEETNDKKYLDYYERTYINAILASQNPETGMMMYFQPMDAGYNKVYNRPFDEFWCCTGTGIESFAKLADTYFYQEDSRVDSNLYFSATVELPELGLRLVQTVDRNKMSVEVKVEASEDDPKTVTLGFRVPNWSNGYVASHHVKEENGFAIATEPLQAGDKVTIDLQPEIQVSPTEDNNEYLAITYGPYVLAADLGDKEVTRDNPNGILVRVGTKDPLAPDTLTYETSDWLTTSKDQFEEISLPDKVIAFKVKNTKEALTFSPYYQMHGRRYGLYFRAIQADSKEEMKIREEKEILAKEQAQILAELTNFDENNSEYAKKLQYERSVIGIEKGRRFRQAQVDGWFAYQFDLSEKENHPVQLQLTFQKEDAGKTLEVTIDDCTKVVTVEEQSEAFFDQKVAFPTECLENKNVKVKFSATNQQAPSIFGITFRKAE